MEKDFAGRTVFITGATGGIGLATAKILAKRGANIAIADLSPAAVEKAAKSLEIEYDIKTLAVPLDVTKPDQVKAAIDKTVSHFSRLDHAVNAAGIPGLKGLGAPFAAYPTDDWNKVMDVNCNGVFYCCRDEVAAMLKAGTKGSIVNISSTAGIIALPTQGTSRYNLLIQLHTSQASTPLSESLVLPLSNTLVQEFESTLWLLDSPTLNYRTVSVVTEKCFRPWRLKCR